MTNSSPNSNLSMILPRVLIVSRRTLRKNKFVDFVGEYHLDLIVGYGAVPVIVPRVAGVHTLLDSFEPIHGVLLCEGEDIEPSHYNSLEPDYSGLSEEELSEIRNMHISDTTIDREKDSIELLLARRCLERNIPYLGICRGSQVLNVACGGTLYQDVERELSKHKNNTNYTKQENNINYTKHENNTNYTKQENNINYTKHKNNTNYTKQENNINYTKHENNTNYTKHIDYANYDGHRHPVKVLKSTPLHDWFKHSLNDQEMELMVNSYHHQGVKRLAERFVPMAFAPDGLVEGFYDPDAYNPEEGKFIMGLQFHPERMRKNGSEEFDYPGCPSAYQEFVKAVIAYQKKVNHVEDAKVGLKLDKEMEKKRRIIVRSFSIAKNMYESGVSSPRSEEAKLKAGAEFLESNTALSLQQEKRLKQMGATVRNASSYLQKMKMNEEREKVARSIMGKMSAEQLSELLSFYHAMGKICSEVLDRKLNAC